MLAPVQSAPARSWAARRSQDDRYGRSTRV